MNDMREVFIGEALTCIFLQRLLIRQERSTLPEQPEVLIIDDEAEIAEELSDWLAVKEIPCAAFTDPLQALEFIKNHKTIKLVLVDRRMPLMDGYDFVTRCRALEGINQFIKFVMITGHLTDLDYEVASLNGVCALTAKPVDTAQLERLVRDELSSP